MESAYFNFALQAIEKLQVKIPHTHFQLAEVRKYTSDRERVEITEFREKATPIANANLSSRAYLAGSKYPRSTNRTIY